MVSEFAIDQIVRTWNVLTSYSGVAQTSWVKCDLQVVDPLNFYLRLGMSLNLFGCSSDQLSEVWILSWSTQFLSQTWNVSNSIRVLIRYEALKISQPETTDAWKINTYGLGICPWNKLSIACSSLATKKVKWWKYTTYIQVMEIYISLRTLT